MKLFFAPGTCALSPHIVLHELGIKFESVKVDLKQKTTADGQDYRVINPKGYVPALEIAPGDVLTEGPAIVQYLADQNPSSGLAPPAGTRDRYRLLEWLNFVSTEVHKQFSTLFNREAPEEFKTVIKAKLQGRFAFLNEHFAANAFLMGSNFSVADAYLFAVMRWAKAFNMSVDEHPNLGAYQQRVAGRPAVKAALEAEGLPTA